MSRGIYEIAGLGIAGQASHVKSGFGNVGTGVKAPSSSKSDDAWRARTTVGGSGSSGASQGVSLPAALPKGTAASTDAQGGAGPTSGSGPLRRRFDHVGAMERQDSDGDGVTDTATGPGGQTYTRRASGDAASADALVWVLVAGAIGLGWYASRGRR